MPTSVNFGEDCVLKMGSEIATFGKKVLIVTGMKSALLSGALEDVIRVLKNESIEYIIYNKIIENPTLDSVIEGANIFKKNNCDFLIGIGGGSPIDAAKAISVICANDFKGREIYIAGSIKKSYPIIAIPTTSGTGTEVTPNSVITDIEKGMKAGFASKYTFPVLSFLDAKYTLSLPEKVTRNTAVDALSHLLEGIFSNKRNKLIYPILFEGVKLIYENLIPVLENPLDLKLREKLMLASMYGGIVIAQTGTTLQHSIGYPMTTEFGVPHGLSNGLVMKHIIDFFLQSIEKELSSLFMYLQCTKEDFFNWLDSLGMNKNFEISEDFVSRRIPEVMATRNMANNPFKVTSEEITNLYRKL